MTGVDEVGRDVVLFEKVVEVDPIVASAFHGCGGDFVFFEPIFDLMQTARKGAEGADVFGATIGWYRDNYLFSSNVNACGFGVNVDVDLVLSFTALVSFLTFFRSLVLFFFHVVTAWFWLRQGDRRECVDILLNGVTPLFSAGATSVLSAWIAPLLGFGISRFAAAITIDTMGYTPVATASYRVHDIFQTKLLSHLSATGGCCLDLSIFIFC